MTKNIALIYQNLALMLDAGLPIIRTLQTLESSADSRTKKVFSNMIAIVSAGGNLAEAMAKNPKFFNKLDINIINAAEVSGNQPQSFKMLSQWYEFSSRLKKRALAGLLLPFTLIHITAVIAPLPSLFLKQTNFIGLIHQMLGILSIVYIPTAIILAIIYLTPEKGIFRKLLDHLALRIPILGNALRELAYSRYTRIFYMLLKAGVPIVQCAEISADATGNAAISNLFKGGCDTAIAGGDVSEGFSRNLPTYFLDLWKIGEQSGKLEDTTKKLADTTAEEAQRRFEEYSVWMPRIAYFFVCAVMVYHIFKNATTISSFY
ncbi:MAG: type II secretion system F family protein [Planctomycetota bacterium]|jgi:type IV pilus assembly protein PilC